jgi:hypothetical protein
MKKILLLLICTAFLATSKAQMSSTSKNNSSRTKSNSAVKTSSSDNSGSLGIKVGWGDLNKNEKKLEPQDVFGDMNNGIYMIRTQGPKLILSENTKHIYLAKYTGNLSQSYEKELIIPAPPEAENSKFKYEDLIYIKGHIYLMTSYKNKADKADYLLAYSIKPDGIVERDMHKMDKIDMSKSHVIIAPYGIGLKKDINMAESDEFGIVLSHDSSKILIKHGENFNKGDNVSLFFKVVDPDLNVLWSKSVQLPFKNGDFELSDFDVDNEGNVVFQGKKNLKGSEKTGKATTDYRLYTYYWKEDKIKEYTFDLGDKVVNDMYFTFDSSNNIMAGGFYSNRNNSDKTDGYFYSFIDRKSETVTSKTVKDFQADFAQKYKFATSKGELNNFQLEKIYSCPNGNLDLVAEQSWDNTVCDKNGCTTRYYSNDILVFCIKPDGNLNWVCDVPKKQRFFDIPHYEGFLYIHSNNNLYFIYNDNPENLNQEKEKLSTFSSANNATIVVACVDADGHMTKKAIPQPDNDNHLAVYTEYGGHISGGDYAILARYKGYYRLGVASVPANE